MGNHCHLLVEAPEANRVAGMPWLQFSTAKLTVGNLPLPAREVSDPPNVSSSPVEN
jgi:hypothetical protein